MPLANVNTNVTTIAHEDFELILHSLSDGSGVDDAQLFKSWAHGTYEVDLALGYVQEFEDGGSGNISGGSRAAGDVGAVGGSGHGSGSGSGSAIGSGIAINSVHDATAIGRVETHSIVVTRI